MQLVFYLPIFSIPCMDYLLYLMFRCDFDVMESLDIGGVFVGSKHTLTSAEIASFVLAKTLKMA